MKKFAQVCRNSGEIYGFYIHRVSFKSCHRLLYNYQLHMIINVFFLSNRRHTFSKWEGPHKMHCSGAFAAIIHNLRPFKIQTKCILDLRHNISLHLRVRPYIHIFGFQDPHAFRCAIFFCFLLFYLYFGLCLQGAYCVVS